MKTTRRSTGFYSMAAPMAVAACIAFYSLASLANVSSLPAILSLLLEEDQCIEEPSALLSLESGQSFEVACSIDLSGSSLSLAANVQLIYKGGEIINGELNFSGMRNKIDGDLLNASLSISNLQIEQSSDVDAPVYSFDFGGVSLSQSEFEFIPSRWGIIEGNIDDATAKQNREALQHAILTVKALSDLNQDGTLDKPVFLIDELDAFFEAEGGRQGSLDTRFSWRFGIQLPSKFHLKMTSRTFLRVQPNAHDLYNFIVGFNVNDLDITGGNIIGDRATHDYGLYPDSTYEKGHLLLLKAAKETTITGTTFKDAIGDGVDINSRGFTYTDSYNQSRDIVIRDCVFDMNGRNNISITDGQDILIEGNHILNAGVVNDEYPNAASNGPWAGIDIEGARRRNSQTGEFIYDEYPNRITIQNNIEKGSRNSGLLVFIGYDSVIQNNQTEKAISILKGTGNLIKNNIITAKPGTESPVGMVVGSIDTQSNSNNRAEGNTITGFKTGISVSSVGSEVMNNTIQEFVTDGISIKGDVSQASITNNNIFSSQARSTGIAISVARINEVSITNNTIMTGFDGLKLSNVNQDAEQAGFNYFISGNTITPGGSRSAILGSSSLGTSTGLNLEANLVRGSTNDGIIRLAGFQNAIIKNNLGEIGSARTLVRFDGNNSLLKNNKTDGGETRNQISGLNNIIEID